MNRPAALRALLMTCSIVIYVTTIVATGWALGEMMHRAPAATAAATTVVAVGLIWTVLYFTDRRGPARQDREP